MMPRNASICMSNAETDGLPVIVDQTPVPRMHVSPAVEQVTEILTLVTTGRTTPQSPHFGVLCLPSPALGWLSEGLRSSPSPHP